MRTQLPVATAAALAGTLCFAPRPALATPPPPQVRAAAEAPAAHDVARPLRRARTLVWTGVGLASAGLVMAAAGFGLLAGVHVGNPGSGMQIEGTDDEAQRALRVARAGQAVGITGAAVTLTGAAVAIAGAVGLRRARRARLAHLRIAPGPTSLTLSGRF